MERVAAQAEEAVVSAERGSSALSRVRRVEGGPGVSLVNLAVESLRSAVLSSGPGVFLGSEPQLMEALGVSRPTFRQATKLLRHEKLLTIKRGMGGGFFTEAPSVDAVTRMAAICLGAQGTTMRQVSDVLAPLQAEAARQLAANPDRSVRACLTEFLARYPDHGGPGEAYSPAERSLRFYRLLGQKAGNPAIALVMDVMRDLVLRDERRTHFLLQPERVATCERYQVRIAQAVLDGDADHAADLCEQHHAEFRSWLPDACLPHAPVPA